jgi:hypothetical protein
MCVYSLFFPSSFVQKHKDHHNTHNTEDERLRHLHKHKQKQLSRTLANQIHDFEAQKKIKASGACSCVNSRDCWCVFNCLRLHSNLYINVCVCMQMPSVKSATQSATPEPHRKQKSERRRRLRERTSAARYVCVCVCVCVSMCCKGLGGESSA